MRNINEKPLGNNAIDNPSSINGEKLKKKARITLIISTIISVLLFIPSLGMLFFAGFLFADLSIFSFQFIFFLIFVTFPLTILVGIIGSWILYKKQKYKKAIRFSLLPLAHILLIILIIVILGILEFLQELFFFS